MKNRARRVPKADLAASVAPLSLFDVLSSLKQAGKITGWREEGQDIAIFGDLTALECALDTQDTQEAAQIAPPVIQDAKRAYFTACRAYMLTASYRALPPENRNIWKLHSDGLSYAVICLKLAVSPMKVRLAIRGARLAAKLSPTTKTLPARGGGRPAGIAPPPLPCKEEGCSDDSFSRNLCRPHYMRRWRKQQSRKKNIGGA